METTATVTLIVNGRQCEDELKKLREEADELSSSLLDAQESGNTIRIEKLSDDLDIVNHKISDFSNTCSHVSRALYDIEDQHSLSDFLQSDVRDFRFLLQWLRKRWDRFSTKNERSVYSGIDAITLESVFRDLSSLSLDSFSKGPVSYNLPNGKTIEISSIDELNTRLDHLLRFLSDMRYVNDIYLSEQNRTDDSDAGLLKINYEYALQQNLLEYSAGTIDLLERKKRDLQAEYDMNIHLLGLQETSEQERHKLRMRNIRIEQRFNDEQHSSDLLAERKRINESYNTQLQELNNFREQGLISFKTFQQKEKELRLTMYQSLAQTYKRHSYDRYDVERKINELIKSDQLSKAREVFKYEEELRKKYFSGFGSVDGRNKADITSEYHSRLEALNHLSINLLENANGDSSKISEINQIIKRAKRQLEIQFKESIGDHIDYTWREQLERFADWFQSDHTQKMISITQNMMSSLSSIWSSFIELQKIDLELSEARLNKRYDVEISRAEGNTKKVHSIEKRKEQELKKLRKDAANRTFGLQVLQAVAQTAQNAITAYGTGMQAGFPVGLVLGPVSAALALAAGAVQIAVIKKQRDAAGEYSTGGFTPSGPKNQPVGIVHAGEWVASQQLVNNKSVRPFLNTLDYAQKHNQAPALTSTIVEQHIYMSSLTESNEKLNETRDELSSQFEHLTFAHYQLISVLGRMDDRLSHPLPAVVSLTGEFGFNESLAEYERLMNNTLPKSRRTSRYQN